MTLIDRLTAAIEARVAIARAATPGPWRIYDVGDIGVIQADDEPERGHEIGMMARCPRHDDRRLEDAEHIADNDPATVIAMCQAHRALVEIAFGYAAKIDGEWGCCHSAEDIRAGLCDRERPDEQLIILTLARAYDLTEEDT